MKVAISSNGTDLDAQVDTRFGRCAFFLLVETDTMAFDCVDNSAMALGGGAGIQAAQLVASKGARAVITGNCGPNAVQTLTAAGVELFLGQSGTGREVIEKFKNKQLSSTGSANVADHYGANGPDAMSGAVQTPSTGSGMGMGGGSGKGGRCMGGGGRGMGGGMGGGRGMGGGMSGGRGFAPETFPNSTPDGNLSKTQELEALKDQMRQISQRIEQLEKK
jgi:predicted Fe-Mo cluster-binding NifX family protein